MDTVPKETLVVSVMTDRHKETCAVVRDEQDDRLLVHTNSKAKTDSQGNRDESSDKRSQILCRYKN